MQVELKDKELVEDKVREAEEIKKAMSAARGVIRRGLKQYIKNKIGARNRAQVDNQRDLYKELDMYDSKIDIQDAYGYEYISENEMYRLLDRWDAREAAKKNAGKYSDLVTEMLEIAIRRVGGEYDELLFEADDVKRQWKKLLKDNDAQLKSAEEAHEAAIADTMNL